MGRERRAGTRPALIPTRSLGGDKMEGRPVVAMTTVLVGTSAAVRALAREVTRLAPLEQPVLLLGERGSGRVGAARELHARSERAAQPFVVAKGSQWQSGIDNLARAAHRGTLCLENTGALGERERSQIAEVIDRRIARVVATTTDEGHHVFARDSDFARIVVPPLAARGEDLPALAKHIFDEARAGMAAAQARSMSSDLVERIARRRWPGNIAELEAAIEAMLRTASGPELVARDLERVTWGDGMPSRDPTFVAPVKLDEVIWLHIRDVLCRTAGNKTQAAKLLGVDPATLHRWIRRKE